MTPRQTRRKFYSAYTTHAKFRQLAHSDNVMQRRAIAVMSGASKLVPIPKNGVDYRGKIVLAPMVRSGELPSRLLALHYGADLVWGKGSKQNFPMMYAEDPGPETVDRSLIGTTRRVNQSLHTIDFTRLPSHGSKNPSKEQKESLIFRIHPEKEGRRLIFQIGTSDPVRAVQAARIVARDVAGIDVNAGCPKPFSTSGGMGAALLQTPDVLCGILEALVKEIIPEFEIGISVKIRLLETPELTETLVRKLCATGITGLTVHCRTTPMRPREKAIREQLKMIGNICRENGVACLMNGDVENRTQAEQLVTEYGVDGAMIASAAEANSSCFRCEANGGVTSWKEVVKKYLIICLEVENRFGNTKYLLGHLIPGKQAVYKQITGSKCYRDICQHLELLDLENRAIEVDESLGIDPELGAQSKNSTKRNCSTVMACGNKGKVRSLEFKSKKVLSVRGVETQSTILRES